MTVDLPEGDGQEATPLSQQYDTPLGLAHSTMQALKDRIKLHYDLASDYYLSLWGEHIHHGYWPSAESQATETKEQAQINLIQLLLDTSGLSNDAHVLDVGCGVGGTARYLASQHGCSVTGITISTRQVEIANRLTQTQAQAARESAASATGENGTGNGARDPLTVDADGFVPLGAGRVRFVELDAEKMAGVFSGQEGTFDAVWISEALSHFPDKALFFRNAHAVLRQGGKLVLADWFKAEDLDVKTMINNIKPIEDGMLLPPLCTQQDYIGLAQKAGLEVLAGPKDISQEVRQTWDITWSLVQNPSLWAFALSQGRDGIAFLQSFRAMRRGFADGSFRYAVMAWQK